jgi:hypothetical protein
MMRGLILILLFPLAARAQWIDSSHEVFLPKKLSQTATGFRDYPLFWWNFISLPPDANADLLCSKIYERLQSDVLKLPCHFDAKNLKALTEDWVADLPRRQDFPEDLDRRMGQTLAKASLPMPGELLPLLRSDPLGALTDLRARLERRVHFTKPLEHGTIRDNERILIPVQLAFSPADNGRTRGFIETLMNLCPECKLFGPHVGAWENEARIRSDVANVSIAGVIGMILLAGYILVTRRMRLVLLLPILTLGVYLGAVFTVLIFGSIHGITLAFGPGIIGLALDYGVHAVFLDPRSKHTWRSNLAGLLTTLAILILMIFSQIPLLKQMMVFSVLGLSFSFILFYFFLRRWPRVFMTKAYAFVPGSWKPGEWLALLMLVACPLVFFRPVDISVQNMNYESPSTIEVRDWFAKNAGALNPFWVEEKGDDALESSHATREWAEANGLEYEGLAASLPRAKEQEAHLKTWRTKACARKPLVSDPLKREFFEPFLRSVECARLEPRDIRLFPPEYAADFVSGGRWVSLLFPKNDEQLSKLRAKFPNAHTPREMFEAFPRIFMFELSWMVPVAFLLALGFLWFHFGSALATFYSIVPFLSGLGCWAIAAAVFHLPLTFISLIGLLMVFGFSLDYGIFVVDLLKAKNEGQHGVWSALSVCSFATLAGFAPLVFAYHPVLRDLGHMLLWGSLGTFVGTFWGIPRLYRWRAA